MHLKKPVGQLTIVPLREAFPHEALDFTTWLEANIQALSDRIGFNLTVLEREKSVGSFNVDLVCEDEQGRLVIVENQLGRSDHDHLGKLLTYFVNLDASVAIWVTPEIRPEHEAVIEWLNTTTGADKAFYLVSVQAVRIGDSPYAPLFTVLAGPDAELKQVGVEKKELAERHVQRYEFWTQLLDRARARGLTLFANVSPSRERVIYAGSGIGGIGIGFIILKSGAGVHLYIDTGDYERNKAIFDTLYAQRDAIETDFGEEIDWRRLDDKQASRIVKTWSDRGTLDTVEQWPELQEMLIDAMVRFDGAIRPHLRRIKD